MNGELAQVICLATHGSAWLADVGNSDPPALDRDNSVFQYVGSLRFRLQHEQGEPDSPAATVADWLLQLRQRSAERIWLALSDAKTATMGDRGIWGHELARFANAGQWGLVVTGGQQPEIWQASWMIGDRDAPGQRIWTVHYAGQFADEIVPQHPNMQRAAEQLSRSLQSARDFAAGQRLESWSEWFDRALTAKDFPYYPDMLPATYTDEAHRLAASAAQAWVFGGMGSWNDLGFRDQAIQDEYLDISRQLYDAVLQALLASTNDGLRRGDNGL